jgi:hypothetical protein
MTEQQALEMAQKAARKAVLAADAKRPPCLVLEIGRDRLEHCLRVLPVRLMESYNGKLPGIVSVDVHVGSEQAHNGDSYVDVRFRLSDIKIATLEPDDDT